MCRPTSTACSRASPPCPPTPPTPPFPPPRRNGGFAAHTALVHADGHTPELAQLLAEMAARTDTGYLFGGLSASRTTSVQFAVGGDGGGGGGEGGGGGRGGGRVRGGRGGGGVGCGVGAVFARHAGLPARECA